MIKKAIPNFLTCLNLVCGVISIHLAYKGQLEWAGLSLFAAAVFDFFDGFVARLLHVKSELGKQLDSLSDVVSFGVAPGVMMFQMMILSNQVWKLEVPNWIFTVALIIPVFAALRLAKFNIDTRQSDSFIGLPTPAVGLLIASFGILVYRNFESPLFPFNDYVLHFILHPATLLSTTLVFSVLMVSRLPLFAMKFKNASWKENKLRYIFMIVSILLLLLFFFTAVPIIILLYLLISIIAALSKPKKQSL